MTSTSTMPVTISAGMSRWNPSVNICPSPPNPISAPTVTRLMLDTAATRSPATITGIDSGSSTAMNRRSGRVAHRRGGVDHDRRARRLSASATVRTSRATV